ncbi:MAG: hypothetical protein ACLR4Z_17645 [Butyricicoccaceae bacterium]
MFISMTTGAHGFSMAITTTGKLRPQSASSRGRLGRDDPPCGDPEGLLRNLRFRWPVRRHQVKAKIANEKGTP